MKNLENWQTQLVCCTKTRWFQNEMPIRTRNNNLHFRDTFTVPHLIRSSLMGYFSRHTLYDLYWWDIFHVTPHTIFTYWIFFMSHLIQSLLMGYFSCHTSYNLHLWNIFHTTPCRLTCQVDDSWPSHKYTQELLL